MQQDGLCKECEAMTGKLLKLNSENSKEPKRDERYTVRLFLYVKNAARYKTSFFERNIKILRMAVVFSLTVS